MTDNNTRNFHILKDRLRGVSREELSKKYGLSRTSITNVVNAQLAKVAEHDHEYRRRLSALMDALESAEAYAREGAETARQISQHNAYLERQIHSRDKQIKALQLQIKSFRASGKAAVERIRALEEAHASSASRLGQEYEQMKENIKRYRR